MKIVPGIICLLLCIQLAHSQEIIFKKNIRLARGLSADRRDAYPVNHGAGKQTYLYLIDNKSVKGLLFDETMSLADSLEGDRPSAKYEDLIGSSKSVSGTNLYFSNKTHKDLIVAQCDFVRKTVIPVAIDLPLTNQKYLGSVSYGEKFYFFTITRASSTLHLYAFADATHYTTRTYNFSNEQFTTNPDQPTIADAIVENAFVTVDNEVPNAIDLVSKKNKFYSYDDKIVLTLDNNDSQTHVITIDIHTFESNLKVFKQGAVDCATGMYTSSNSNSYIYKNTLYQIRICPQTMVFTLKDMNEDKILNEFRAGKDDEMDFKNGPVVQKKGNIATISFSPEERELSKTRQFLRKVSNGDPGISVYEVRGSLEVTLGSNKEVTAGTMRPGGIGTGSMSTSGGMMSMPNPTYYAYGAYKSSKSVILKSLLDPQTFQHRKGETSPNAFDKIQSFTKDKEDGITADTIFKQGHVLLFGYYFKPDRRYVIRGFKD